MNVVTENTEQAPQHVVSASEHYRASYARWLRKRPLTSPWLHEEVASRMLTRLDDILLPVKSVAVDAPLSGGWAASQALHTKYPKAAWQLIEPDARARRASQQRMQNESGAWPSVQLVSAATGAGVDLWWSNMQLHHATDLDATLSRYANSVSGGGFVLFSCLGPESLTELAAVYEALGWGALSRGFLDMHDLGDQLLKAGFSDPVVDREVITLRYSGAAQALAELADMGHNCALTRHTGLRTPAWRERLLAALLPPGADALELSFEVIYGHAIKPQKTRVPVTGQSRFSLAAMRQHLGMG